MTQKRCGLVLLLCLLLGGCAAGELRDANDRLTSYYLAKQQARDAQDWRMLEASLASLQSLAEDAAGQARAAQNRLNAISLYRVAATAAWQAGDGTVVAYGREGQALCDDATFNQAPRDCGMLLVIPTLAGVDETTGRVNDLQAEVSSAGDAAGITLRQRAEQVYDDYLQALDGLLARRADIQSSDAHPGFKQQVDENIASLFCEQLDSSTRGLLVLTDSGREAELDAALNERGCRILGAGILRSSLRCFTASCD